MKNILSFLTLFLALTVQTSIAQQKQLRVEDYANPAFRPKAIVQLQWRADSENYTFVESNTLMQSDLNGNKTQLLTLDELNTALASTENPEALKGFPSVEWIDEQTFQFVNHPSLIRVDLTTKKATILNWWNVDAEHFDVSSKNHVAYVTKGTLHVSVAGAKKPQEVSKGDGHNILCGMSVHRDEFGISKGTFWSPNGEKLAFYRMNQSMVTDFPMADYRTRTATPKLIKYPMAGEKSHHVTIGVYDIKKKKVKYLQTGEPAEQYLTNVTWSPDGNLIYVQVVNRDQNHAKLNVYDAKSGAFLKTLLEEKSDKYVEPLHELTFLPNNPNQFIYQSQRDGYNHLYLYNTDGTFVKALTSGAWMVLDLQGFSKDGQSLFLTSTKESALENHAYRLDLATAALTRLTNEAGTHFTKVAVSGKYVLDTYSSQNTFYKVTLNDANGNAIKTINQQEDPFAGYEKPEITLMNMKAADGTNLHARLIKPTNFDPNKKYPVMYYVYGGPHAQLIQNRWLGAADMFMMYMASQGYVVFTLDNRGSGNRGRDFEQATFSQLGTVEMQDQMIGIDFLKAQSYVDTERMGCFGWSFGGFMTTSMMSRKPAVGTFKAAVAGGPVIDWKYYEIMYTERYMDTPQSNPEGYKQASLLNYVTDLKGKLIIIEGLEDGTVVPQHCYAYINECIAKGVLIDFFPYPNHEHNVRGRDRIHMYKKIAQYFDANLK